jgi:hypothetical protein
VYGGDFGRRCAENNLKEKIMVTVIFVLTIAALIIAIWSAVKPAPILWIAVVLLAMAVMIEHAPGGFIR